jgi:hypothetical protein
MNIIQVQDRLKGVDDQSLVGYVERPTPDVPTYLALGELQRREQMRAKYQAQATPTETVSEEIVAKATPQMGIGALTNSMSAPQMPQPEMMSESETITETGIANLPAPNVGNYAEGGIVGEERDMFDIVVDDYVSPGLDAAGLFMGKFAGPIVGGMWPGEVQAAERYSPEEMAGIMGYAPGGLVDNLRGRNPNLSGVTRPTEIAEAGQFFFEDLPGGNEAFEAFTEAQKRAAPPLFPADQRRQTEQLKKQFKSPYAIELEKLDQKPYSEYTQQDRANKRYLKEQEDKYWEGSSDVQEKAKKSALEAEVQKNLANQQPPAAPAKEVTMADRIAEFKSLMGDDTYNDMLAEKMKKMDASADRQAEIAPWMALTEAGLAIAAGQDQNALTNIASGATRGIESYAASEKERRALEEQQFDTAIQLRQAERAEQLAAIQYGVDSKQFEDTQANKLALANQDAQLKMVLKQMADPKDRASVLTDDVTQTALAEFDKAYANANGDDTIGSPAHIAAKKIYTNQVVQETLSAGQGVGTLDTSGFSMRN